MMNETSLEKQDCVELFQMFIDDLPMQLQEIEEATNQNNYQELQAIAHRLKGASGSLRLKKVTSVMLELENAAKATNFSLSKSILKRIVEMVKTEDDEDFNS